LLIILEIRVRAQFNIIKDDQGERRRHILETYIGVIDSERDKIKNFSLGYLSKGEEGLSPRDLINPKEKEATIYISRSKDRTE
jgi:hypothetical protein